MFAALGLGSSTGFAALVPFTEEHLNLVPDLSRWLLDLAVKHDLWDNMSWDSVKEHISKAAATCKMLLMERGREATVLALRQADAKGKQKARQRSGSEESIQFGGRQAKVAKAAHHHREYDINSENMDEDYSDVFRNI